MNIRKAPIIDLVEFIIEEKASENNYNSILELINKYYTIIEHEQILPIITAQEAILKDWCFGDYSYDMSKMPNTEGLLVVNKEGLWGITTLYYNRTDDPVIKI